MAKGADGEEHRRRNCHPSSPRAAPGFGETSARPGHRGVRLVSKADGEAVHPTHTDARPGSESRSLRPRAIRSPGKEQEQRSYRV